MFWMRAYPLLGQVGGGWHKQLIFTTIRVQPSPLERYSQAPSKWVSYLPFPSLCYTPSLKKANTYRQRVVDGLQRTMLSRRRMIWILPLPLPPTPSPVSKLSLFFSVFLCVAPVELTIGRGGGKGKEPNHTTARKPGPLQSIKNSLSLLSGVAKSKSTRDRSVNYWMCVWQKKIEKLILHIQCTTCCT